MIHISGTVTYRGGEVERVEVTQAEYAAFELWAIRAGLNPAPDQAPVMAMTRYLGYAACHAGRPQREWESFEDWWPRVVDVTLEGELDVELDAGAAVFPQARSAE